MNVNFNIVKLIFDKLEQSIYYYLIQHAIEKYKGQTLLLKNGYGYLQFVYSDNCQNEIHSKMSDKIFKFDDKIWSYNYPPSHYECNCYVISKSNVEIKNNKIIISKFEDIYDNKIIEDELMFEKWKKFLSSYDPLIISQNFSLEEIHFHIKYLFKNRFISGENESNSKTTFTALNNFADNAYPLIEILNNSNNLQKLSEYNTDDIDIRELKEYLNVK